VDLKHKERHKRNNINKKESKKYKDKGLLVLKTNPY
jgi:hypothetical protein